MAPPLVDTQAEVGVMSKDLTNGDACDIIANDGIGYAVTCYCDGGSFKDPETTRLWDLADKGLKDLQAYLERETGRDLDDE